MANRHRYIIVGGQLAGAHAADGIRELDGDGSILLLGRENHPPYDRPPLSKALWLGKKKLEDIFVYDQAYYERQHIDVRLGATVAAVDPGAKTVTDSHGATFEFEKLLLATGGRPRRLTVPGSDLPGVLHYRQLDDYMRARHLAREGAAALVIGGGFIGSEMAAALHANKVRVTMLFDAPYLVDRVFPEGLGRALQKDYVDRGITVHVNDTAEALEATGDRIRVRTRGGLDIAADLVVVGIGLVPETSLAEQAGLEVNNGIVVDEQLRTSHPDIYAAGDNASFPYQALGRRMRIEHWDHAVNQGKHAGRNMAGAGQAYTYMPYFFSDLFEFGYEAVGQVDSRLDVFADWQEKNKTGVLYYRENGLIRGVMLCNVWGKVEAARDLIRRGKKLTDEDLWGAIA